jgi:hypothetical protein
MKKSVSENLMESVNSPYHYSCQGIECIEYIEQQLTSEEFRGYLLGNVHKYLHRHKYKNEMEDLKKMQWYFDKYLVKYDDWGDEE